MLLFVLISEVVPSVFCTVTVLGAVAGSDAAVIGAGGSCAVLIVVTVVAVVFRAGTVVTVGVTSVVPAAIAD